MQLKKLPTLQGLPTLHNEKQAAELLTISIASLRRYRYTGKIEYTCIGERKICYTEKQLNDFISRSARRDTQD